MESEIQENQNAPAPAPLNTTENPINSEPVNTVAEQIAPGELLKPRGRGRPPGSKTKNRRGPNGKFLSSASALAEPQQEFISQIPGDQNPGGAPASPGPSPEQIPGFNAAAASAGTDYRALAVMTVGMSTGILSGVFGPEWKPESEEEMNSIVLPLEAYLRIKQCPDIPPGALLALAIIGYSAKRLHAQPTKTKLVRFWWWIKSKFSRNKKGNRIIAMPSPEPAPEPIYPQPSQPANNGGNLP